MTESCRTTRRNNGILFSMPRLIGLSERFAGSAEGYTSESASECPYENPSGFPLASANEEKSKDKAVLSFPQKPFPLKLFPNGFSQDARALEACVDLSNREVSMIKMFIDDSDGVHDSFAIVTDLNTNPEYTPQ